MKEKENEYIVIIKETSVDGYIELQDLTKGGDIKRRKNYTETKTLMEVDEIYLVLVMIFTYMVKCLERRLRNSER